MLKLLLEMSKICILIRPKDYFSGRIISKGVQVSQIYGTYLGYLEFDNKRYWDVREVTACPFHSNNETLPSDGLFRDDLQIYQMGDLNGAQLAKEEIKNLKRYDRALREAFEKSMKHKQ